MTSNGTYEQGTFDTQRAILFQKYDLIRHSVSAREVGQVFGLEIDSHGRCRCPFHNGTDKNMVVYKEERGFYCFVCHEYGDCIKLAQKLIGGDCRYNDAAIQLDHMFHLNIFEDKKPSIRERIRRAADAKRRGGIGA